MSAEADLIGKTVNCPSCAVSITVESPTAEAREAGSVAWPDDASKVPDKSKSPSATNSDHYMLLVGSEQRGPLALSQLRSMWRSGTITADAHYWQRGLKEWLPISRISDLLDPPNQPAVPVPSPRAATEVSRRVSDLPPVVVKTYKGTQDEANAAFRRDAEFMAAKGYFPTSQTWTPGEYGCGSFLGALLLCVVLIGFLVFIYMLIVKPPGTLTVNYTLR